MRKESEEEKKKVKLLDCTIRDGGLVNNFYFSDPFIKHLYEVNLKTGIDYMEFGYKASEKLFDKSKFGKWKFTSEEDVRNIVGEKDSRIKLSAMLDVGRTDMDSLLPEKESIFSMLRIATYAHQTNEALELIEHCNRLGYETTVNIMAISDKSEAEIQEFLEVFGKSPVDTIYLVDSFGAFYPEDIKRLTEIYVACGDQYGKKIGIHAHNNMQMALANTIEASRGGISILDATVDGLGRGAGNCPMELLLGYLNKQGSHYAKSPILEFIQNDMEDLKQKGARWGYEIPYFLTGHLGVHPNKAINFIKDKKTDYLSMYQEILMES